MSFVMARLKAGHTPRVREKAVAAGQTFKKGAALVMDANGAFAEAGADPAAVAAIACSDFGVDATGFSRLGRSEFPPGFMQGVTVGEEEPFHAEYLGTLPAAPGGSYGITKDTDGRWKVDFSKTSTTARVKLLSTQWTEAPLNRNRVEVCFLPTVVQII